MEKIKIGRIVNAVALRGEVKVYNYSGYKERYEELDRIIVDEKEYEIEIKDFFEHLKNEKVEYQKVKNILDKVYGGDHND